MPKLNEEQFRKLTELQSRANSGDILSEKETSALNEAEDIGVLPKRDIVDRVGAQLQGETGLENLESAASLGVEVGGATGGAILGAQVPVPLPLRPITTLVGAGIGAMGGNILAQLGIQGKEELDIAETGLAGGLEVLFPGVGKIAQATFRKGKEALRGLSGAGKKPTPFKSATAEDLARETQKAGVSVPLATVFEGRLLSTMDSIASKSLTGGGLMSKQTQSTQQFLEKRVENFAEKFTSEASPLDVARQLQKALKGDVQTFRDLRNKMYSRLDTASFQKEGAKVDLDFMGKGSVSFKEAAQILEGATNSKLIPRIKGEMRKSARRLDSKQVRVDEGAAQAKFSENRFLAEELAEISSRANLTSPSTFLDDLNIAFDLTEKMGQKFNQTLIRELAETSPESLLDVMLKQGKPDTIRAVFKAKDLDGNTLLSDDLKNGIRSVFLGLKGEGTGLLSRAAEVHNGVQRINGKKLLSEITKFEGSIGKGVSMALFPGTGLEGTKRFGRMLEVLQGSRGEGTGAMAMFLQLPSAVQMLIGGGLVAGATAVSGGEVGTSTIIGLAGAGTIVFGPKALAKMLTNPKTFNNFAKGFEKRLNKPDDMVFYLTTIAAQMAKEGDDVRFIDQEATESLLEVQRQANKSKTQQSMLQTLANAPI